MNLRPVLYRARVLFSILGGTFLCLISTGRADFTNGAPATVVLGNQKLSGQGTFFGVGGVAVDPASGKVFVCDVGSNRVLRFSAAASLTNGALAEAVFGQSDFTSVLAGVAPNRMDGPLDADVDAAGRLWVADSRNQRVLRFDNAVTRPMVTGGINADGVLGQEDFFTFGFFEIPAADDMANPTAVAVDGNRLWVADAFRNRILRFDNAAAKPNGANADGVLGQAGFAAGAPGIGASKLDAPYGIAVQSGVLWVADYFNARVVRFDNAAAKPNGANADGVLGQLDLDDNFYPEIYNGLTFLPIDVTVGPSGVLWVGDYNLYRALRFDNAAAKANGAASDGVLGAADFVSPGMIVGPAGFVPESLCADANLNLWVSDTAATNPSDERVLRFANAASKPDGSPADSVLGQNTLDEILPPPPSAAAMNGPTGVAVDPVSKKVFVADTGNNRVLRFATWSALISGAAAEGVLGQPGFESADTFDPTVNLYRPAGICFDSEGRLWVADTYNNRVLKFNAAASKANGAPPDGVFGQPDFETTEGAFNIAADTLNLPEGVCADAAGRLWVTDTFSNRVLRFDDAKNKADGAAADRVLGQADMSDADFGLGDRVMDSPRRVTMDAGGNLWVSDDFNNRILGFLSAASKASGSAADIVLGQPDLDTNESDYFHAGGEMTFDSTGRMWICDETTVVRLDDPLNSDEIDIVLGQEDAGIRQPGLSLQAIAGATASCMDPGGNLWVADTLNNRVLRFDPASTTVITITGSGFSGNPLRFFVKFRVNDGSPAGAVKPISFRVDTAGSLAPWTVGTVLSTTGAETTWTDPATVTGRMFYRIVEVP